MKIKEYKAKDLNNENTEANVVDYYAEVNIFSQNPKTKVYSLPYD